MKAIACPHCNFVADGASDLRGGTYEPKNGDISVCVQCAGISALEVAGDAIAIRKVSVDEFIEMPAAMRGELKRIQAAIAHVAKSRAATA